jgi:CRISPR/Cas system CSM-associated protein Csm2 small subunit
MSDLQKLLGKSKIFTIGELELEIKPRTLKDIDLMMDLSNEEKKGEAMKELIKRTLKDAVSDATDEEINNVAITHFKVLSEAIVEVNNLGEK